MATTEQQFLEAETQLQTEVAREELELTREESEETEENEATEENYANQLVVEQESYLAEQQAASLYEKGMRFRSPSMSKYGILFSLAIVNDVVDILTFTGILEVLVWAVSMGLTATILLIMWFTDTDLKRAYEYTDNAAGTAEQAVISLQAQQMESQIRGKAESVAKNLRKIPGLKNTGVRKVPRKNPLARAFVGGAIESVPFLGTLNLISIWILMSYMAERHAFKSAREAAETSYSQISETASEMI